MDFSNFDPQSPKLIKPKKIGDERGFFSRLYCEELFKAAGIINPIVQINSSYSQKAGTIRGLHFQMAPWSEEKIIKVINGAILDIIIDLRPNSKTYKKSFEFNLSRENYDTLYVPKGFAHGFQTLVSNTEVIYLVTQKYSPNFEKGIRFDDPAFNLKWSLEPFDISDKDKAWPNFDPITLNLEALECYA